MKTNTIFNIAATIPLALAMTGCGGGGGGSPSTPTAFTSFTAAPRGTPLSLSGMSTETTYTYNTTTNKITSIGTLSAVADGATVSTTYATNGVPTSMQATSAQGTALSFNAANGDTFGQLIINNNIDAAISANNQSYILSANPYDLGWDYQTFGTWVTGAGTGSGTVGMASVGATTVAANIPTTGTATYTGVTGGRYAAANGDDYFTSSNLSAAANFGTRALAVTSSGTQVTRDLLAIVTAPANLDFTGNLAYNAGSNQFTGNITTTSGLNGTMTGKFYGPAAQEIGGAFTAQAGGASLEGYMGAFGAKRP
jgi:hypothetical protein